MKFTESEAIFLKKCNAQNLSTATITNYKYCLKTFFDFCQKRNITDIEQVNQYNVMDFMSFTNQNSRCTTARDKFVVIKAYFTYLTDIGIIDINPMIRMKKPKTDNKTKIARNIPQVKASIFTSICHHPLKCAVIFA